MIRAAVVFATSITLLLFAQTASAATPQVAIADQSTCFVTDAGAVSCQGDNLNGQLAQPASVTSSSTPLPVVGLPPVAHLEAANEFFCALGDAGQVHCWGAGTLGQIGDGASADAFAPTAVPGITGALQIDGLDNAMCALFPGGAVKCWGQNSQQFGGAYATGDYPSPVDIAGFADSSTIAQGDDVLCGLFAGGTVRCQGNNVEGQAGQPMATTVVTTPTDVPGVAGAIDVAAGEDFTCALLGDGTAQCWGDGDDGRLGQGADVTDKFAPVVVQGLSGAVKIGLGEEHACALRGDGAVLCWGESTNGQSGQSADFVDVATQVAGIGPAVDLFVGYDGACALLAGGTVSCWGDNPVGGFGEPVGVPVLSPRAMPGIDLVTLPQSAQSATLTFSGKAKVDRRKRNYTRSAKLTITPSKYVPLGEACVGTATATTSYRYVAKRTKTVRGKRKSVKVRRTKRIRSRATLRVEGATCTATFSLRKLPVKYLNRKSIRVTSTTAGNASLAATTVTAKTRLPKVKLKK